MVVQRKSVCFFCVISEKALPLQKDKNRYEIRFLGMA